MSQRLDGTKSFGTIADGIWYSTAISSDYYKKTRTRKRMELMSCARKEVAQIRAEERAPRVITTNVPPSASFNVKTGDVLVGYNEKEKKWKQGPLVIEIKGKQV